MKQLDGKKILVTGACGTVGQELVKRLLGLQDQVPATVVGLDNNESALFYLDQHYQTDQRAQFFVTDICDRDALAHRMDDIDVVFHTAALKHVVLCERSPIDTVRTNVQGVKNIIDIARQAGVGRVIFTSSDKAVNPVNVMGETKRSGERLMTAAAQHSNQTIYASIRFGNVLGSSGSVVPLFHQQIAGGGPVTLTDPGMIRFVMSAGRAAELIIESAAVARGGEIYVTKMPVARIADLATVMIRELAPLYRKNPADIELRLIGAKPGEKLHEELMSIDETRHAIGLEHFFEIQPEYRNNSDRADPDRDGPGKPYVAAQQTPMDQATLTAFLRDNALLSAPIPSSLWGEG